MKKSKPLSVKRGKRPKSVMKKAWETRRAKAEKTEIRRLMLEGVKATPGTAASNADPRNPNVPQAINQASMIPRSDEVFALIRHHCDFLSSTRYTLEAPSKSALLEAACRIVGLLSMLPDEAT